MMSSRHLDHGHFHCLLGDRPRIFSLPNMPPLVYFWLILSPDDTSELMTVLW